MALEVTAPLLTQQLIRHVVLANSFRDAQTAGTLAGIEAPPPLGATVGLAIGLFAMMQVSSISGTHYYQTVFLLGMFARQAVSFVRFASLTGQVLDLISRKTMYVTLCRVEAHFVGGCLAKPACNSAMVT